MRRKRLLGVLSGHLVPKYLELRTRIREGDFENFVYEVVISIQFVQGLFEHFQLKIKIHPNRTIEAYQPGMERNIVGRRWWSVSPSLSRPIRSPSYHSSGIPAAHCRMV
jgi:hypothetical protein